MFRAPLQRGTRFPGHRAADLPRLPRNQPPRAVAGLRIAGLVTLLVLGLPQRASAQGSGTMQAAARVVPATTSWTGVREARAAALAILEHPGTGSTVRLAGLVRTTAELQGSGSRRRVLVTIHHPHN